MVSFAAICVLTGKQLDMAWKLPVDMQCFRRHLQGGQAIRLIGVLLALVLLPGV